jgi:hypothetical protein
LEQRVVSDLGRDDLVDRPHHLDGVGGRFLEDVQGHGVLEVEVTAELDDRLLVADLGDVAEAEPLVVDGEAVDLRERAEGAHRPRRVTQPPVVRLAEDHVSRGSLEVPDQRADVDVVLPDSVQDQVDEDLLGSDAVQVHAGDPGDAADPVDDAGFQEVVVRREVDPPGGDPPFDDRNVRGVEGEDDDFADPLRQLGLDLLDLFADLHADDVQVLTPLELEIEEGTVGARVRGELLDVGEGRQHLLHRLGDLFFHLGGAGVGVRHLDADERDVHLGEESER